MESFYNIWGIKVIIEIRQIINGKWIKSNYTAYKLKINVLHLIKVLYGRWNFTVVFEIPFCRWGICGYEG